MQLDKEQIIEFLRTRGEAGKAEQADKELPQKVDTDEHGDLLSRLGVDIPALLGNITGGGGGLGGLLDR